MGEGKRLQEYLKNKNIKIAQLSRESGISQNTLYATIKRDSSISAETLNKLAHALKISTAELAEIISVDSSKKESFKPRVIEDELEQTLLDTRQIIEKLNYLTHEYEYALKKRANLTSAIANSKRRISSLQSEIENFESELAVIDVDIANRQLELKILREKLSDGE